MCVCVCGYVCVWNLCINSHDHVIAEPTSQFAGNDTEEIESSINK